MGVEDLLKEDRYPRNKALSGAYRKGVRAFMEGKPCKAPYSDARTWYGGVTWSRAFIRMWEDGWRDAEKESKK